MQIVAVPEDEPGGYVAVEQHGRDGTVFGTQLLVQPHGVVLGLGPVQPPQPTGGEAVQCGPYGVLAAARAMGVEFAGGHAMGRAAGGGTMGPSGPGRWE